MLHEKPKRNVNLVFNGTSFVNPNRSFSVISLKQKNLKKYSLKLLYCLRCSLVQVSKSPSKFKMFGTSYEYRTGLSKLMVNHLKDSLHYFRKKKFVKKDSVVLDIGSNDGTFLNFFKNTNLLIGIDPSLNKFKRFYNKKIIKIYNFFSKKAFGLLLTESKITFSLHIHFC